MTTIRIDYINYPHGGRALADYTGEGGDYDFTGLVALMAPGPWPDILGIGEADRWDFQGYRGAFEACRALNQAGGPPYEPRVGSLPRDGGPFGPALLINPQTIRTRRWFDHRCPDAAPDRTRNLLAFSLPHQTTIHRVVVIHGDIHSGLQRLLDFCRLDRLAGPETGCIIIGDCNATPSGPRWEARDFATNPAAHRPDRMFHKIRWRTGTDWTRPYREDTDALDALCGTWVAGPRDPRSLWLHRRPGRRVGGMGWYDIAELADDPTPTQLQHWSGRRPRTIDRALVNTPLRDTYTPGSYHVYPPPDPPASDHLRISFALTL